MARRTDEFNRQQQQLEEQRRQELQRQQQQLDEQRRQELQRQQQMQQQQLLQQQQLQQQQQLDEQRRQEELRQKKQQEDLVRVQREEQLRIEQERAARERAAAMDPVNVMAKKLANSGVPPEMIPIMAQYLVDFNARSLLLASRGVFYSYFLISFHSFPFQWHFKYFYFCY